MTTRSDGYNRLLTVASAMLITLGFTYFFIQLGSGSAKPSAAPVVKKTMQFLITSPVAESEMREAIGQEAIIYVRSREAGRIQVKEFIPVQDRVREHPSYGFLAGEGELFQREDALYLGLTPAKVGNSVIVETSRLSVSAVLYSFGE